MLLFELLLLWLLLLLLFPIKLKEDRDVLLLDDEEELQFPPNIRKIGMIDIAKYSR